MINIFSKEEETLRSDLRAANNLLEQIRRELSDVGGVTILDKIHNLKNKITTMQITNNRNNKFILEVQTSWAKIQEGILGMNAATGINLASGPISINDSTKI